MFCQGTKEFTFSSFSLHPGPVYFLHGSLCCAPHCCFLSCTSQFSLLVYSCTLIARICISITSTHFLNHKCQSRKSSFYAPLSSMSLLYSPLFFVHCLSLSLLPLNLFFCPCRSLFDRLKEAALEEWNEYVFHPFLKQLGTHTLCPSFLSPFPLFVYLTFLAAAGTLPLACFQHYITQVSPSFFDFSSSASLLPPSFVY